MGLFDQFRKNKEEQRKRENSTTPPPMGHSLAEIMKDKKKLHLFGELLKKDGNDALAARVLTGRLDEYDIDRLEEQRKVFSEKIIKAEKIEKLLTVEYVISLARNNPDFEKIVNQLRPEGAIKVITSQLKDLAITNETRFNDIASKMDAKEGYLGDEYKKLNDRVEKLLNDKNISQEEYLDILKIKDSNEKRKALVILAKRGRMFGRLDKDFLSKLEGSAVTMEESINQLSIQEASIGSALFMSVNENKDVREAFANELIGERVASESKQGLKELRKDAFDEATVDEHWKRAKETTQYSQAKNDPARLEAFKNEFRDREKKLNNKKNKGTGFWDDIIRALFGGMVDKKELK